MSQVNQDYPASYYYANQPSGPTVEDYAEMAKSLGKIGYKYVGKPVGEKASQWGHKASQWGHNVAEQMQDPYTAGAFAAAVGLVAAGDHYVKNSCYWTPENLNCYYDIQDVKHYIDSKPEKAFAMIEQCQHKTIQGCSDFTEDNLTELYRKDGAKLYTSLYNCVDETKDCSLFSKAGITVLLKNSIYKVQSIAEDCLSKKSEFCTQVFELGKGNFSSDFVSYISSNCDASKQLSCLAIKG